MAFQFSNYFRIKKGEKKTKSVNYTNHFNVKNFTKFYHLTCLLFLVFFQLKNSNELFHCSNGAFIKKEHVCNGNTECLDGSDEADCQDGEYYGTWNSNSPTNSSRKRRLHLDRLHLREMTPGEKARRTFLAWDDFHARSRFTRSTIPEEKWGLLVV